MTTAPSLTIRNVQVLALDVPADPPLRNSLNVISRVPLVVAIVDTEEGVSGTAYVFAYAMEALGATAALTREIGALLVGRKVAPFDLWRELHNRFRLLGTEGLVQIALAALDMALWDCQARAAGVPLCRLLGSEPRPIPAYASLRGWGPDMLSAEADAAVTRFGVDAVKFKIGQPRLVDDLTTIRTVREAVGSDVAIMVDFNQGLDRPEAERRGRALADLDVRWIEEPLPADDNAGLADLRTRLSVPVQGGENWWGYRGMAAALAAGSVDLCMPDVMKIGGVTGWIQAAGLAAAHRIPMSSHMFVEASAHLLMVTPTAHYLELMDIAAPLLREPLLIRDGVAHVPNRPGLGIEWDADALARYTVDR